MLLGIFFVSLSLNLESGIIFLNRPDAGHRLRLRRQLPPQTKILQSRRWPKTSMIVKVQKDASFFKIINFIFLCKQPTALGPSLAVNYRTVNVGLKVRVRPNLAVNFI